MNTNSMSLNFRIKPEKPSEPISPPGGNIENRKPPVEPKAPKIPVINEDISVITQSKNFWSTFDVYI